MKEKLNFDISIYLTSTGDETKDEELITKAHFALVQAFNKKAKIQFMQKSLYEDYPDSSRYRLNFSLTI